MEQKVSYERVVQILQDYVDADYEACCEASYIYSVLTNTCGMSKEEMKELGFGYILDAMESVWR